jgi:uncharacterized alkaline shock family protein YloU
MSQLTSLIPKAQGALTRTDSTPGTVLSPGSAASLVLIGERGKTEVRDDVVAAIAGLAARATPGVHALVPFGAGQTITSLAQALTGQEVRDIGVRVRVGTVETAIDVRVTVEYGESIPRVAADLRGRIIEAVEQATGLSVKAVTVYVVDLHFPEDELPPESTGEEELELR